MSFFEILINHVLGIRMNVFDLVITREGGLGLPVDGDVPPRHPFWTQKSGRKITEMEAKNPGIVIVMKLIYLFFFDIDHYKSNHSCKLQ